MKRFNFARIQAWLAALLVVGTLGGVCVPILAHASPNTIEDTHSHRKLLQKALVRGTLTPAARESLEKLIHCSDEGVRDKMASIILGFYHKGQLTRPEARGYLQVIEKQSSLDATTWEVYDRELR